MNNIEELFVFDADSWLNTIPAYQRNIISTLYKQENDYEAVAKIWLTTSLSNTVQFGTEKHHSIYYDKILDEIEAFLRGEARYKDDRLSLLKESGCVQNIVVGSVSVALSQVLGVTASFLAPVIVVSLMLITKIGVNAWLAKREQERKESENLDKKLAQ